MHSELRVRLCPQPLCSSHRFSWPQKLSVSKPGGGNKSFAESCLVLPLATGMTITLALLTLKQVCPELFTRLFGRFTYNSLFHDQMRPATARYVLWPRMDQKSCLKSIQTAGKLSLHSP